MNGFKLTSRPATLRGWDDDKVDFVTRNTTLHEISPLGEKEPVAALEDEGLARSFLGFLNSMPVKRAMLILKGVGEMAVASQFKDPRSPLGPMRRPGEHRFGD